jgi:hypothetical protein
MRNGSPFPHFLYGMERLVDPSLQTGRQPLGFPFPILEAGWAIAGFPVAPGSATGATGIELGFDARFVHKFTKEDHFGACRPLQ